MRHADRHPPIGRRQAADAERRTIGVRRIALRRLVARVDPAQCDLARRHHARGAVSVGELGPAFYCHCQRCRKASGSAFGANAIVAAGDFVITAGADSLRIFTATTGLKRTFCGQCGSPLTSVRDTQPDIVRVRMGIARALVKYDEKLRGVLRKNGMLTRDDRMVERKKPGLKGARKRPQYSKR